MFKLTYSNRKQISGCLVTQWWVGEKERGIKKSHKESWECAH